MNPNPSLLVTRCLPPVPEVRPDRAWRDRFITAFDLPVVIAWATSERLYIDFRNPYEWMDVTICHSMKFVKNCSAFAGCGVRLRVAGTRCGEVSFCRVQTSPDVLGGPGFHIADFAGHA